LKYIPNHFGKHGFIRPSRIRREVLVANVGEIDEALDELVKMGIAQFEGGTYKVNMGALGVSKVLGKGRVTHPIEISADEFSEAAKRKLEGAGGRAISGEGDGGTSEAEV
jgi:large subunit ribosomal protein L15